MLVQTQLRPALRLPENAILVGDLVARPMVETGELAVHAVTTREGLWCGNVTNSTRGRRNFHSVVDAKGYRYSPTFPSLEHAVLSPLVGPAADPSCGIEFGTYVDGLMVREVADAIVNSCSLIVHALTTREGFFVGSVTEWWKGRDRHKFLTSDADGTLLASNHGLGLAVRALRKAVSC